MRDEERRKGGREEKGYAEEEQEEQESKTDTPRVGIDGLTVQSISRGAATWARARREAVTERENRKKALADLKGMLLGASTPGVSHGDAGREGLSRGQAAIKRSLVAAAGSKSDSDSDSNSDSKSSIPPPPSAEDQKEVLRRAAPLPLRNFMPGTPLQGAGKYAAAAEAAALSSPSMSLDASVRRGEGLLSGAAAMLGVSLQRSKGRKGGDRSGLFSDLAGGNATSGGGTQDQGRGRGRGLFDGRRLSVSSLASSSYSGSGSGSGWEQQLGHEHVLEDQQAQAHAQAQAGQDALWAGKLRATEATGLNASVGRDAARIQHAREQRMGQRTEAAAAAMAASALRIAKKQ